MLRNKAMCIGVLVLVGIAVLTVIGLSVAGQATDGFFWVLTWVFVAWTVMACSAMAVALSRGLLPWLMRAGILSACWLCVAYILGYGFELFEHREWLDRTLGMNFVFTLYCGHIAMLMLQQPRQRRFLLVRRLAAVFSTLLGAAWMGYAVIESFDLMGIPDELAAAALGILSALVAGASFAMPVLMRLDELLAPPAVETFEAPKLVQVICPRCGLSQEIIAGADGGRCAGCSLHIEVRVADSRCACGYLIVGPSGGRCPECGRELKDERRPVRGPTGTGTGRLPVGSLRSESI
jgi:hypothetical protein